MNGYFKLHPEIKLPEPVMTFSFNWRGYRALFTFIENELILEDIFVYSEIHPINADEIKKIKKEKDRWTYLFSTRGDKSVKYLFVNEKEPVLKIDWYNGLLEGFCKEEEKGIAIQLKDGKIIREKTFDYAEYNQLIEKWPDIHWNYTKEKYFGVENNQFEKKWTDILLNYTNGT
jgi:hypothetical protein